MSGNPAGSEGVLIEPMGVGDAKAVARLDSELQPTPWSARLFRDEIRREAGCYLVARPHSGGPVVGYGGLLLLHDEGHIATVGVAPAWRRRGLGRRLVGGLARGAIEQGACSLTLEVRASNIPAQRLYQSLGFAPAGVRPGYYRRPTEDAVIMWAHEVDGAAYRALLDRVDPSPAGSAREVR